MMLDQNVLNQAVPWQECYAKVAEAARQYLDGLDEWEVLSTSEMADVLLPAVKNRENAAARTRLFKALAALPKHEMAGYCSRGPATWVAAYAKTIQPWRWHRPKPIECCPACHRPLEIA
jgi:hypothetical protein